MPGAIEALRSQRQTVLGEMETLSRIETGLTAEQRTRWDELETQITDIDGDISRHERQAEREQRAAAARASESGGQSADLTPSGIQVTSEPQVYGRGSGHSYFLDMARTELRRGDGDGGVHAAQERLNRHGAELRVEMPKRREARERRARDQYDRAMVSGNRAERRAAERGLERMARLGVTPFERRAMNRVDGTGGYLVPPLWLVDEYIPYLRAGREFADLWRGMELPAGTDNINIPRITQGSAVGPQAADGAPVAGRDMNDAFVTAKVQTISGQMDVALQLLEQTPISNFDEITFQDLAADYNLNLSGQCYLGSNSAGQIKGVWPGGNLANTNGIYLANSNNTANQTWVNGGGATFSVNGSVFQGTAQLASVVARTRLRTPTAHVWHSWVWFNLLTQVDQQGRPLVVPGTPNNTGFNQVAVDTDGPEVAGPVGYYQGLPVIVDPNMPTTFGTAPNPVISTISNGQFASVPGGGVYTPLLLGYWDDLFLWEGEMRTRALDQVLSGNMQMRFQLYNYVASMPDRYEAYADVVTGGATVAKAGSPVSYATLSQFQSNGVLSMTGMGF